MYSEHIAWSKENTSVIYPVDLLHINTRVSQFVYTITIACLLSFSDRQRCFLYVNARKSVSECACVASAARTVMTHFVCPLFFFFACKKLKD